MADTVDAEILRIEQEADMLAGLLQQRQLQKQQTEAQRPFYKPSSSISKLPTEVLSSIFGLLADNDLYEWEDLGVDDDEEMDNNGLPGVWYSEGLTLARVCRSWRNVALTTPALWADIQVAITETMELKLYEKLMERVVRFLLNRSKCYPLDIMVSFVDERSWAQPTWNLLLATRDRWRSFEFRYRDWDDSNIFSKFPAAPLPLLEELRLDGEYNTLSFFSDTPKLETLHSTSECLDDISIPFAQITDVHAVYWDLDEASDAFLLFTSPCSVTMRTVTRLTDGSVEISPVTLPKRCHSLKIGANDSERNDFKFTYFRCSPALKDLSLTGNIAGNSAGLSPADFRAFLDQSQCSLTSLTLTTVKITSESLLAILRLVPSLTHLDVSEVNRDPVLATITAERPIVAPLLSPDMLKQLQASDSRSSGSPKALLLPSLTHIELRALCEQVTDKQIVDMVHYRAINGLRVFRLHMLDRSFASKTFDRLRDVVGPSFQAEIAASPRSGDGKRCLSDVW